ncbi:MAG TPA: ACT domain-containing protein, partial [Deferrisomatales bacterium]|nr:ACT domain-containing protein [Deferrisomatales bacterium]
GELVAVLDELLCMLGKEAGWDKFGCALVALGGYGRGEMAPHSDVDLLFLMRRDSDAGEIDQVLYPLWDLGLDVGHALRTPADCAAMAARDLTAATAFLDARHLLGDVGLFERARKKAGLRPGGSRETRRWVSKIIADVADRRRRFGEVSHLLEPHIKEGSGGLRDLQASRWVLACLGLELERELSPPGDSQAIGRALPFLNRCRNALHTAAGRKTDHLTFELHQEVAGRVMPGQPLDGFFEALHRASHSVVATWDQVAARAQQELLPRRKRRLAQTPPRLPEPLAEDLVRWCRDGGEFPEDLRFAFTTGSGEVLGSAVTAAAARLLRTRIPLAPLLRQLHSLGRLGLFAPELDAVAHQVHYDARHAFTTGVHCIETLDVLERLWLGELEREEPHLTRIASAVLHPAAARLSAVCHDLGKRGGVDGHEERGEEVARGLALRLGLTPSEADGAAQLTRHHHAIARIAFGEDLEDPASWEGARSAAGSATGLDALVALAFADMLATNPHTGSGVWSDWKRDLLLLLHARAWESGREGNGGPGRTSLLKMAVAEAASDQGLGEVTAGWDLIPTREVEQVPPDLLARLLHLGHSLGTGPACWHVEPRGNGLVEVTGAVAPLPRVLGATTATLASLGLDVLSFQVHTWADGTIHLWFRLTAPSGGVSAAELARRLTDALTGGASAPRTPEPVRLPNRRNEAVPVQTRVHLAAGDNPFHSVLELRCRDRKGLIRDLARLFDDLGLTVEYALVTTHGPMAQDIFHLKDIFGGRVDGEAKRQALLDGVEEAARRAT